MRTIVLSLLVVQVLSAAPPALLSISSQGAQSGNSSTITVTGTLDPWPMQVWASQKGIEFKPTKDKGKFTVTVTKDVPAGMYWVRLFNADGASEQRPFFVSPLPEVAEVEPNDDPTKPQILKESSVVTGKLNPMGDVDHYAVDTKKGQTIVASLLANNILKSPMDGMLQLLDANGFVVAENNDAHGLDPEIAYAVPKDGRYVVRVYAFPATPDSSIRFFGSDACIYRLTLTTGGFADHAFPAAVSLKDPSPVELRGWNIPDAAKKLTIKPDRIGDRFPVTHPAIGNAVAIRVEPHRSLIETEPNDADHPQEVQTPVTIGGHIGTPGDVDVFQFQLAKGDKRLIRIEADAIGSPLDPVLRIFDESGKVLNESRTGKSGADPAEIAFTAPVDGNYRVEVRDLYKHGGERYVYRLRIAAIEPDFFLSLAADQFTMNAGESLEIPVTINKVNGFNQPVELRALDLPPGVTSEPGKPDAAKSVKLKLSAKSAVSGPIRIVGVGGNVERTARATIPNYAVPSEAIFLTVRPAKK